MVMNEKLALRKEAAARGETAKIKGKDGHACFLAMTPPR
jgi:hypothetical protein